MITHNFLLLVVMCSSILFAQIQFEDEHTFSQAVQKMTAKLYLEEAKHSIDDNIVISPISVHMAMSLLYYGSKGKSRKQLKKGLGLENIRKREHLEEVKFILENYRDLNDENITLAIANAMYVANDFNVKTEFSSLIQTQFNAEIQSLNFTQKRNVIDIINNWVANNTNNLICSLVTEDTIDTDSRMVIMNAVYFKAKWLIPFDERHTTKKNFTLINKDQKKVDFMFISNELESAFIDELNATIVALPYADDDYKMVIFHPDESSDISILENSLFRDSEHMMVEEYITQLKTRETELFLPKFETGSDISLVKHFQEMGVTDIFGEDANFTGISDETGNAVSDIIHKTKIKVSEEGSEAAAATAVIFTKVFKPKPKIIINSPFIFFIFDTKTNIPIFMGEIFDPSSSQKTQEDEENRTKIEERAYEAIVEI